MPDAIRSPIVIQLPLDDEWIPFPLDQVTALVWDAATKVEDYCCRKGTASPGDYLAIENVVQAICGLLEALDRFDPSLVDHPARREVRLPVSDG